MRTKIALCWLGLILAANGALSAEQPRWQPHLFVTATGCVYSPGGVDKDRYLASLGGGMSLLYWFNWDTQILLSGSYSSLNTERYYWRPESLADSTLDYWDVRGELFVVSAEVRRLFPTDNRNFIYLGIGADYFNFGTVDGQYEIYGTGSPVVGQIKEKRDPDQAIGGHLVPGLFFLFHPKVSMDVAVRLHLLYDGEETIFWLQPAFTLGYRVF